MNSKGGPKLVNFELNSYPKGWEVWLQIVVSDQSTHLIPSIAAVHVVTKTRNDLLQWSTMTYDDLQWSTMTYMYNLS